MRQGVPARVEVAGDQRRRRSEVQPHPVARGLQSFPRDRRANGWPGCVFHL